MNKDKNGTNGSWNLKESKFICECWIECNSTTQNLPLLTPHPLLLYTFLINIFSSPRFTLFHFILSFSTNLHFISIFSGSRINPRAKSQGFVCSRLGFAIQKGLQHNLLLVCLLLPLCCKNVQKFIKKCIF